MADPKLIGKRQPINQPVSVAGASKSASQKAVRQFSSQNNIVKNTLAEPSRDSLANILSKKSASNDSSYPKCSPTSGNPCIDTGGYIPKRAYPGSGMAGWPQAGLSGNFVNNTTTEERVEFAQVYLPKVGMGITAMGAAMLAPQAVPYMVESAGASYMSMNAASYTATGLLADEVILYSAGGAAAYFTPASPPTNPIEALGLGASIATDLLK